MEHDRNAKIEIGGRTFELLLTTRATKEIAGRYGGLENLGQKLMRSENFETALDELVWLITLLANQSVLIQISETQRTNRSFSRRRRSSCSPVLWNWQSTNPPSWRPCSRERSGMWKARTIQKTHQSGNRRGTVHPAFLLRNGPAASSIRGGLADAVRFSPRSVGMSQAIPRHGKAEAGAFYRRYYPARHLTARLGGVRNAEKH